MANLDLTKYGITGTTEIVHNPSYELLFEEETKPELVGYEKGQVSELGAVNVMTGVYTGRSPKDKYIVMDENSKDTVWWTSDEYKNDNHPMSESTWATVKDIAKKELCNKRLFVVDAFCGANKDTRMAIRFIVEVAWQAHFVTNMFIKPTAEELENFEPDFVVYNASKAKVENYKELGLNSETCVAFNITSHEQVIINTWYGGEMKKGMFSMMNYFLSGFTAKLAGTERGITEPTPTFSACFGQAFLELHPTKYAEELVKKMEKSGAKAYLVNTGWNGTGKRISIKDTRGIIDAILSGAINEAPTKKIPYFDFEVPTSLPGVDPAILDPRDTYADAAEWNKKAEDLASRFIKNFAKYEGNEHGKALVSAGPQL